MKAARLFAIPRPVLLVGALVVVFPFLNPSVLWSDYVVRSPHEYGFIFDRFSISGFAIVAALHALVAGVGYLAARTYLDPLGGPRVVRWVAGFFPGYLLALGLLRALTLVAPHGWVSIVAVVSLIFLGGILSFSANEAVPGVTLKTELTALGAILALGLITFVINIYVGSSGGHYFTGHGIIPYAGYVSTFHLASPTDHLPILRTHYDEVLFGYFLYLFPGVEIFPSALFWVTNCCAKLAVACWLFLVLRAFGVGRTLAILGSLFLYIGTTTLSPVQYQLLFDSQNPFCFVLHAGRVVGIPFIFMLILDLFRRTGDAAARVPLSRAVLLVLAGLGLPATPTHNVALLFAFYGAGWALLALQAVAPGHVLPPRRWARVIFCACALPPFFAYAPRGPVPGLVLVISMAAFFLEMARIVLVLARESVSVWEWANRRSAPLTLALLGVPLVFSTLFLGNIGTSASRGELVAGAMRRSGVAPDLQVADPLNKSWAGLKEIPTRAFVNSVSTHPFEHIYKNWSEYDKGGLYFLNYYGLVYLLALVGWLVFSSGASPPAGSQAGSDVWAAMLLLSLGALATFFFYADFVTGLEFNWVKSRFFEAPVYCILLFAVIAMGQLPRAAWRKAAGVFLVVYTLLPFFATKRPAQMQLNLRYFMRNLS